MNIEATLDRLKQTDWHLSLFAIICSSTVLYGYDLSCVPGRDAHIAVAFLVTNIFGFLVSVASFFSYLMKPAIQIAVTGLIAVYYIADAIVLFIAFIAAIIHFTETDDNPCPSDDVIDMYFIWMILTTFCNLVYLCYTKMRKRKKSDNREELIIRGSHRTSSPVKR